MDAASIQQLAEEALALSEKATKGPFFAERGRVVLHDPRRTIVATVYEWHKFYSRQEQEQLDTDTMAFASFMTSAPLLAQAVLKLMPFVDHHGDCNLFTGLNEATDKCDCGLSTALAALDAEART